MKFITEKEKAELLKINWKVQTIIRKYGITGIVFKPNGEYDIIYKTTSHNAPKEKQE